MSVMRRITRRVNVRDLAIGGGSPVSIQSMTSIPIEDVKGTIEQIQRLRDAGADLVRIAVRNEESIRYLREVRKEISMPLSADVHFNYRIAIMAVEAGIDKIRINPGNIGGEEKVREVLRAAGGRGVPIRVGVNGGSLDEKKYPSLTPENLAASAMDHVKILEDHGFRDIVVSIKSSDIFQTIEANRIFSRLSDIPLHIGLTEAGFGLSCVVQSSMAIGHLLLEGIGDTVRVSMTGDPVEEVKVARRILEAAGARTAPVRIISCPTCGRTDPELDVLDLAMRVEREAEARFSVRLAELGKSVTIAVMGCEVNGPGEACHADLGVAGGRGGSMLLFSRGRKIKKISVGEAVEAIAREIETLLRRG